jgi:hypothetical protein
MRGIKTLPGGPCVTLSVKSGMGGSYIKTTHTSGPRTAAQTVFSSHKKQQPLLKINNLLCRALCTYMLRSALL